MCLCVNHRQTDTVIRKYTGNTHFLFLCQSHWRQEVRGTTALLFLLADEKKLVLSQLPPTYTKDLGGWDRSRLLPLWKPITTNPIMSLECNVDAVNGLWWNDLHMSPLPWTIANSYPNEKRKKGVCLCLIACVCVCVCVCTCAWKLGRGSSQNQVEPQKNKEFGDGKQAWVVALKDWLRL